METDERLVNVTIMSTESDILRELDFAAIIKDFAVAIEKGVWPLNVDCVGRYNHSILSACGYNHGGI